MDDDAGTPLLNGIGLAILVVVAVLTRWKANFGTGTTHMQGNADADGDVDGADFLMWQRQLGRSSVIAAGEQVPEPIALLLASLAGGGLAILRPPPLSFITVVRQAR